MARKILFADDEKDIRMIIRDMIAGDEFDVLTVPDGLAALKEMRRKLPDLVILDIAMPRAGGFEVCRQMKEDEQFRRLPVIILSAFTRDKVGHEADLADIYLHKPFQEEDLMQAIHTLLLESA